MLRRSTAPRRRIATMALAVVLLPLSVLTAPLSGGGSDASFDPGSLGLVAGADHYQYAAGGPSAAAEVPGAPALDADHVRPLAQLIMAVGVDHQHVVDAPTIERAAEALGVEIERPIVPDDVDTLLAAHRDQLAPLLVEMGVEVEDGVDEGALADAAAIADVELASDAAIDPLVVAEISQGVERWAYRNLPTQPFASDSDVDLFVPSRYAVQIGYHEASSPDSRQMTALETDTSTTTLPSRGRGTGSRTAVDISVEDGTPVLAPASGEVVEVSTYTLYGQYQDAKVRIVSDENPDMLISVVHVTAPTVSVGDTVEGGVTVIAEESTKFPFASQIDRIAGDLPHVHIEIRQR